MLEYWYPVLAQPEAGYPLGGPENLFWGILILSIIGGGFLLRCFLKAFVVTRVTPDETDRTVVGEQPRFYSTLGVYSVGSVVIAFTFWAALNFIYGDALAMLLLAVVWLIVALVEATILIGGMHCYAEPVIYINIIDVFGFVVLLVILNI